MNSNAVFKNSNLESLKIIAQQQDRTYQIWERNSLCVELYSLGVFDQKLDYIHYNPVKAGLYEHPEQYDMDRFNILTHINL